MSEHRELTTTELTDLATALRELDWSWQLADVPALAARFGWQVVLARPNWVMLDTGLGTSSGKVHGADGRAVRIETRLTEFATEDAEGAERIGTAFAELSAVLIAALGAPTGRPTQLRWPGPTTTVVLALSPVSVVLSLVTNDRLAQDDRNVAAGQDVS
ncbi:DUF6301 family protein [Nocardia sp. AG03]|uniref:DUF6301 family protein n=1 Tax=Nocardia sp. AG03 TaxID=3025312 RepID=UPI0024182425|nr:DUF6301 family protein [Nocardia sp. AG03]